MSSKETSPEDTVLDNSIGNVRKAETQVTNNAVFDPFSVHDLVSPSIMIDCATRSVAEELSIDGLRELNGPTVLQQGLTSEAFRVLAADPQALMSVGGSSRSQSSSTPAHLSASPTTKMTSMDL